MPKKEDPKKKVVVVEEVEASDEKETTETVSSKELEKNEEVASHVSVSESKTEDGKQEVFTDDLDDEEKPNYLWIIVPTALLVGALVGGLITYFTGISSLGQVDPSPTPIATATPNTEATPEPTASTSLKREDVKVQVLNGSGVSGAAGKVKTLLEGLGYKDVDTGNASSTDVAVTEVSVKESKKEFVKLVIKDLAKSYEAVEASKPLVASSKYDIVITLGKK